MSKTNIVPVEQAGKEGKLMAATKEKEFTKLMIRDEEGNKYTQKALLALLAHAIDGNNVEQLRKAEDDLKNYLIDR